MLPAGPISRIEEKKIRRRGDEERQKDDADVPDRLLQETVDDRYQERARELEQIEQDRPESDDERDDQDQASEREAYPHRQQSDGDRGGEEHESCDSEAESSHRRTFPNCEFTKFAVANEPAFAAYSAMPDRSIHSRRSATFEHFKGRRAQEVGIGLGSAQKRLEGHGAHSVELCQELPLLGAPA